MLVSSGVAKMCHDFRLAILFGVGELSGAWEIVSPVGRRLVAANSEGLE